VQRREDPAVVRERVAELGRCAAGREQAQDVGKLSVTQRAAREARNPATGATIQIAASRAAKFSAAAGLKQQLNG
jgi:nucleoid DNA-binding protein